MSNPSRLLTNPKATNARISRSLLSAEKDPPWDHTDADYLYSEFFISRASLLFTVAPSTYSFACPSTAEGTAH